MQFKSRARRGNRLQSPKRARRIHRADDWPDIAKHAARDLVAQRPGEPFRQWNTTLRPVLDFESCTPISNGKPLEANPISVAFKKKPEAFHSLELNFLCNRFAIDQDAIAVKYDSVHRNQPSVFPVSAISLPVA